MKSERTPQCILGNGECPKECTLYEFSAQTTAVFGDAFDPQASRQNIVFADAFNPNVNVIQIARVMASCAKEGKIDTNNPTPLTPQTPPQQ